MLVREAYANDGITLDKAVELIGSRYYCNERFHTANVLSRLVKMGKLKRVKPGFFTKPDNKDNNIGLFTQY